MPTEVRVSGSPFIRLPLMSLGRAVRPNRDLAPDSPRLAAGGPASLGACVCDAVPRGTPGRFSPSPGGRTRTCRDRVCHPPVAKTIHLSATNLRSLHYGREIEPESRSSFDRLRMGLRAGKFRMYSGRDEEARLQVGQMTTRPTAPFDPFALSRFSSGQARPSTRSTALRAGRLRMRLRAGKAQD